MSTDRRLAMGIVLGFAILGRAGGAFANSWSPEVTIFPQQQDLAINAFAINAAGSEVWLTSTQQTSLSVTVTGAQRTFGGTWSSPATIASVHATSLPITVALSANNDAVATWADDITLRSAAGVWQAPVSLNLPGSASNLQAQLDAQGNGVAVWGILTGSNSVVEAVTWSAGGAPGSIVQLSPSSHGAFLPQLAVNDAGTAVVVWLAAPTGDNADPYQVESATRPAGGSWSAVTTVSPDVPQTWAPGVTLDAAGNATAMWTTGEQLYAATRPAGGAWGGATQIEPSNWHALSQNAMAADAAGDVTVSWVGQDTTGQNNVRTATLPAGGTWGAPTTLGQCKIVSSSCLVHVSAAHDGSIAVVGWGTTNSTLSNVAVRLASGAWTPMTVGTNSPQLSFVLATNNAHASVVWSVSAGVKYRLDLRQSDFR